MGMWGPSPTDERRLSDRRRGRSDPGSLRRARARAAEGWDRGPIATEWRKTAIRPLRERENTWFDSRHSDAERRPQEVHVERTWNVTITFMDGETTSIKDAHIVGHEGDWLVVSRYDGDYGDRNGQRIWRYSGNNVREVSQI